MGRPIKKQNFGNVANADNQLQCDADLGAGVEKCWIMEQVGSRKYMVASVSGGGTPDRTGRVTLQQSEPAAPGEARLAVTPFDGVANVTAIGDAVITAGEVTDVTVTNGGSGYSTAPTVTITGDGTTPPTATASITGGVVTSVTVNGDGTNDFTSATITFSAPAAGGGTEWAKTIQQYTVKTWEGNVYSWELNANAGAVGEADLDRA